jgi:hypothetical protein
MKPVALAFALLAGNIGCNQSAGPDRSKMNFRELVESFGASPIEDSIAPIAEHLAPTTVFVGIDESTSKWRVAADKNGDFWAYFYTDLDEFRSTFPQGGQFAELAFQDAFQIVESDSKFRGIFLNSNSKQFYPIPREMFPNVRQTLDATGDD